MTKRIAGMLAAAAIATFAPQAPAAMVTSNFGGYSVTYDAGTSFSGIDFNSSGGGGSVGFGWNFAASSVSNSGGTIIGSTTIALPDFTINANPGYTLSGPLTGLVGNLSYTSFGVGSSVAVSVTGQVSVDAGPASPLTLNLVATQSGPFSGTFAGSTTMATNGFTSVQFSGGVLAAALNAPAGLALLDTQPQNFISLSFIAIPVPEPEAYLLLLAGLGLIGAIARRRGS
jgi:hypothetical protein